MNDTRIGFVRAAAETVGFLIQSKYKYQAKGFRIYHGGMKPPSRGREKANQSQNEQTLSRLFFMQKAR